MSVVRLLKPMLPALARSGARRRSLLLSFMPVGDRASIEACRAVRNVRSEVFISS
ncbi:hypothetical protein [Bradyrhizobium sp. LCT2]|uniref:hypothetical protein n=1 Tax=Bradyrhizobium sp. LCT2 TaxID=2493093 RepID=UPI00192A5052|nr:hypothetical protein [Bradyrhizobium sp. LCT2]